MTMQEQEQTLPHVKEKAGHNSNEGEIKFSMSETVESDDFLGDHEGQLAIDVYHTAKHIMIESPVAGVAAEDLDISISNESVTIKGKREGANTAPNKDYLFQECYWGRFARSVILPQEIDAERAEASIRDGILIIKLPKLIHAKTKKA